MNGFVRNAQRKKLAKAARLNELLHIMKLWDLTKADVAFISEVPYNTVQVGFTDHRRVSEERLDKYISDMKAYIKAHPSAFSDLEVSEEMIGAIN